MSRRRISRAFSRAWPSRFWPHQESGEEARESRALRPMPHMVSWGLASARRRSPVCPRAKRISSFCKNVAMLPRGTMCSQSFCKRSWPKWRTDCEAFVLSGSHALRPMPYNLSWGLARGGGVGQCARGPGIFSRFGRILPGCLGRLNVRILAARVRDRSGVHDGRGVFARGDRQ